jgi:hypothetical protein
MNERVNEEMMEHFMGNLLEHVEEPCVFQLVLSLLKGEAAPSSPSSSSSKGGEVAAGVENRCRFLKHLVRWGLLKRLSLHVSAPIKGSTGDTDGGGGDDAASSGNDRDGGASHGLQHDGHHHLLSRPWNRSSAHIDASAELMIAVVDLFARASDDDEDGDEDGDVEVAKGVLKVWQ